MDRARKWIVATTAVVAVSASTSAFAQTKPKDTDNAGEAKTQTVRAQDANAKKAKEQQEEMDRARASQTVVTSADAPPPSGAPAPGAEKSALRLNVPLLVTGAVVLGAAYIPSATVAIVGRDDERAMLLPVLGPWISLGQKDCNEEPCSAEGLDKALIVTSGILQGAGFVAMALSVFIPPPSKGSLPSLTGSATKPKVQVTPVSFGRSGAGIGAVGTF